jgi:hypothetical protein
VKRYKVGSLAAASGGRGTGMAVRAGAVVMTLAPMVLTLAAGCGGPRPGGRPVIAAPAPARTVLITVDERKRPALAPSTAPAPVESAAPSNPAAATTAATPTAPTTALAPSTRPAEPGSDAAKAKVAFATVAAALGLPGVYRGADVYVVTVPRDDLTVLIDGMAVPPAAGLESTFWFYYCPCGKTSVVGQFCVLDHESNDVIDALRAARIEIASVGPMVLHARQAPLAIRFHAEGQPEPLAKAIREALRSTGKERSPAVEKPAGPAEP